MYGILSAGRVEWSSTQLIVGDKVEPLAVWIVAVRLEFDTVRFLQVAVSNDNADIIHVNSPAPTCRAFPTGHPDLPRHFYSGL